MHHRSLTWLAADHIEADRDAFEGHTAGIPEQSEIGNFARTYESRSAQRIRQNLHIQADEMIIMLVDVTAKDHAHDHEAILIRQCSAIEKKPRENVQIWHAHIENSAGHQDPPPFL